MLLNIIGNHWKAFIVIFIIFFFLMWLFFRHEELGSPTIDREHGINEENHDSNVDQYRSGDIVPVVDDPNREPISLPITTSSPEINKKRRSRGEVECCRVMTELFGVHFGTYRPDFLRNPATGKNLELDCYNPDLKIAVEYNGMQHYVWPGYPGQTKEAFYDQVRRDEYKYNRCNEEGVYLITVPYHVEIDKIRNYIVEKLPAEYAGVA